MFRKTLITITILTFAFTALAVAADPTIIGATKCKMCHKAKTGDQFQIWSDSGHAKAFETLKSEASIAIATEKGLGNPWEEAACLKCHSTQAFLGAEVDATGKYDQIEGVSCEACHGAGSEYKAKKIMEDRAASVAAGMHLADETTCLKCHNEESPTFKGFEYAAMWDKIKHPVPEAVAE